jgi:hypothetical protein
MTVMAFHGAFGGAAGDDVTDGSSGTGQRRLTLAPAAGRRQGAAVTGRPALRDGYRAARLSALITARSDASTIDSLMPTPQSTCSPMAISR